MMCWLGVGASSLQEILQLFQYPCHFFLYLFIGKPYHRYAKGIQHVASCCILLFFFIMDPTVNFYHNVLLVTIEIRNRKRFVITHGKEKRVLPVKLQAEKFPVSDFFPKEPFCWRGSTS